MSSSFADLGVSAEACRALQARGITSAFPIQALAIPPALAGNDICGRAPTGSGKTIAFGIPVAARVGRSRPGSPRALILAPTRELAGQIEAEMTQLFGRGRRGRVAAFYGGVGFGAQLNALRRGVDVAVACPGRLNDLVARRAMSLSDVSIVVIDEADRMADMGFLPEVKRILDQVRPDRQTLLFSATLDGDVEELVRRYQREPVEVSVQTDEERSSATHEWVDARREDRVALAAELVSLHGRTVVFCRTKHGTDRVAKQLVAAGVKAIPLHGGRTQSQREQALKAFSTGRAHALVATDVAARGIHVDDVRCVVHFDLPQTAKDYLHRSGRTGRAGADGTVVSFVTSTDTGAARALRKAIGQPMSSPTSDQKVNDRGGRNGGPGRPRRVHPPRPRAASPSPQPQSDSGPQSQSHRGPQPQSHRGPQPQSDSGRRQSRPSGGPKAGIKAGGTKAGGTKAGGAKAGAQSRRAAPANARSSRRRSKAA